MQSLKDFFTATYYAPPLLLVVNLVTLCIIYPNKNKFKYLNQFIYYLSISLAQTTVCFLCVIFKLPHSQEINNLSIYAFAGAELTILYSLLTNLLKSKHFVNMIHAFKIIFILLLSYTLLSTGLSENIPSTFTVVNYLLLAIPCVFYFYETFTEPPLISLSHQPAFWIIIGYLFMAICTLPFYLLENYISKYLPAHYHLFYNLNYIFYCLLFSLISKAFLCKQVAT